MRELPDGTRWPPTPWSADTERVDGLTPLPTSRVRTSSVSQQEGNSSKERYCRPCRTPLGESDLNSKALPAPPSLGAFSDGTRSSVPPPASANSDIVYLKCQVQTWRAASPHVLLSVSGEEKLPQPASYVLLRFNKHSKQRRPIFLRIKDVRVNLRGVPLSKKGWCVPPQPLESPVLR